MNLENNLYNKKISVVVPAYNSSETINQCLNSVMNQDYSSLEIIVVDDASRDNTLGKIRNFNVKIIANQQNMGAAYARNLGVKNTDAEIIIFVDSDVIIPPHAVSHVSSLLVKQPDILGIGAIFSDNSKHLNFISDYKNLELAYRSSLRPGYVKYLGSFFLALKKDIFLEAGGFSTHFHGSSVEDIELGYRITQGKRKMLIDKNIKIEHLKKYSFFSMLKTDFGRIYNMIKIIKLSQARYKAGEEASVRSFINLILPVSFFISIIFGIFFKIYWLNLSLGIIFIINNLGFLNFLTKRREAIFAIKSISILFCEYFFVSIFIGLSIFLTTINFATYKNDQAIK